MHTSPTTTGTSRVDAQHQRAASGSPKLTTSSSPRIDPRPDEGSPRVPLDASTSLHTSGAAAIARKPTGFHANPRSKAFMSEFCSTGLAYVVFHKKAVYWSSSEPVPTPEQREADARSLREQLGEGYYPEYDHKAKDAVELLGEETTRLGKSVDHEHYAVIHIEDAKGMTHFGVVCKPLLAAKIAGSPEDFGLPAHASPQQIHARVEFICVPANFLACVRSPMLGHLLFTDKVSIRKFGENAKLSAAQRAPLEHPMSAVIRDEIDAVPTDLREQTVRPNGMVYFNGDTPEEIAGTERDAQANLDAAAEINATMQGLLQQAQAEDPTATFGSVAFKTTIERMYR